MDWFEFAGLTSGLLCVILLIRQNIWTWPIGLVYALVSLVVFYDKQLFAEVGLHVFYVGMNAYGWYYWLYGGGSRQQEVLKVVNTSRSQMWVLVAISIVGTALLGTLLDRYTPADIAYVDSSIAVMSLVAMWMTAKKQIENWVLWWVIDILATGVYVYKGIYMYAILYFVYLGLAIVGWQTWRRAQTSH